MLPPKASASVVEDLTDLFKRSYQDRVLLLSVGVDDSLAYYDAFGPEQERNVRDAIYSVAKGLDGIAYASLFTASEQMHGCGLAAVSLSSQDANKLAQNMKKTLEGLTMPLSGQDLKPKQIGNLILDPRKISVHVGAAAYQGKQAPDAGKLLELGSLAEEHANKDPSRIHVSNLQ